ncbi:alpha/beta hydrolase [Myxococcus sp. K15C18031901]|uniref:esterase/lipase family protein n=1 Tax=Myxococcus dinghuensis TaxID=2906761 RepID=UPI0020A7AE92|nr:alpha/beta hydrolase [Myxococcus dinghuensis]MCP3103916.1 alpha/beta hydrolase [Myxococcus dinghuensis]
MATRRMDIRAVVAVVGLVGVACSNQEPGGEQPGPGTQVPAAVKACRDRIAAKTAEVEAAGIDIATWSIQDASEMKELTTTTPQNQDNYLSYDGKYRPVTNHPGCAVDNLYYDKTNTTGSTPYVDGNNDGKWTGNSAFGGPNAATGFLPGDRAKIPGYPCAAKEYTQPNEDTSKPIIVLVHGNSTRPHTWEKFILPPGTPPTTAYENVQFTADTTARDQLAEKLIAAHYRVIAVDFRTDVVTSIDPSANSTTQNSSGNIDHGWSTPILQSLLKAVMKDQPNRKVALIAHSLGVTVARDALRRMYVEWQAGKAGAINPFPQVSHVILGSGANHGVSTYDPALGSLCATNTTMRGTIVCEMGSRSNYVQTYFHKPLNGPRDLFATPCADGDYAFGKTGQCGENVVKYYTITMTDKEKGTNYQDLYVSEAASRIEMDGCVTNTLTTLTDYDTSGYFNKGFIANHFGSLRSSSGLDLAMRYLAE